MSPPRPIRSLVLARGTRYRWDALRRQHQLVFPEGVLVLNETGAAVVRLCDGRSAEELIAALEDEFPGSQPAGDVAEFLERLARKGLLRDDPDA
jgi:pyrroloquinoline quinone biosynthesis protein D